MAVQILLSRSDDRAGLYCSTSGWMFGPLFEHDAEAKAEHFLDWFRDGHARDAAAELRIQTRGIGLDGDDPRDYRAGDLEKLYGAWRNEVLDENGELRPEVIA